MIDRKKSKLIGSHLEKVIRGKVGGLHWDLYQLNRAWGVVVGKRAAAHTQPAWIRKDVLWVFVSGSAWMQELNYIKPEILVKANECLDSVALVDIRWLQQPAQDSSLQPVEFKVPDRAITPEREEGFLQMSKTVADTDCQQALFKLWQTFQKKMRR
jgi:predicted nucleic acid-binding Zn ribbon protein